MTVDARDKAPVSEEGVQCGVGQGGSDIRRAEVDACWVGFSFLRVARACGQCVEGWMEAARDGRERHSGRARLDECGRAKGQERWLWVGRCAERHAL